MYVGVLRVRLHIPAARSLKDRRMVVRRCVDRLRARTAASVAEVGPLDRWQVATLGVCAVSNDAAVTESQLLKALDVIEGAIVGDAVVTSQEHELRRYEDSDFFGDLSVSPRAHGGHDGEGTDDDEELPR